MHKLRGCELAIACEARPAVNAPAARLLPWSRARAPRIGRGRGPTRARRPRRACVCDSRRLPRPLAPPVPCRAGRRLPQATAAQRAVLALSPAPALRAQAGFLASLRVCHHCPFCGSLIGSISLKHNARVCLEVLLSVKKFTDLGCIRATAQRAVARPAHGLMQNVDIVQCAIRLSVRFGTDSAMTPVGREGRC
jgi:hypothetical protein